MNTHIKIKVNFIFKLLVLILSLNFAQAGNNLTPSDTFDGNYLTASLVQVDNDLVYENVVMTISSVVSISGGTDYYANDYYDTKTNQLTIPQVTVGGKIYTNVIVKVGKIISIGGVLSSGIPLSGIWFYCKKIDCVDNMSKFKNFYTIAPSKSPLVLNTASNLSTNQSSVAKQADVLFDKNPYVALLLIDKDNIVFERYHPLVNNKTPLLVYSESKSFTSLAVGKALCSGLLPGLDVKMKSVNPQLTGLSYGEATIKQVLTMSSGAPRGTISSGGSPPLAPPYPNSPSSPFYYWDTFQVLKLFGGYQLDSTGNQVKAGQEFSYKNYDTLSLSFLFYQNQTNFFPEVFSQVWNDMKAENNSYWNYDRTGMVPTHSGFHAVPRDMARVGVTLKNIMQSKSTDCYTQYVQAAMTTQIKNNWKLFTNPEEQTSKINNGYGYQFWTEYVNDSTGTVYMRGALGQVLAINPNTGRIMVLFSYDESYEAQALDMFANWQKLN